MVSVIIPVYNVEKYIRRCIDSIINQTLKNIEIIIIDDGSTDKSGHICDEYAAYDKRVHVIHKSNEGLSCARNDGIKNSTAPFIMFVDGDDWVDSDFCESPYKMSRIYNADLVLFSYKRAYNDGTVSRFETNRKSGILTEAEAMHYNAFEVWAVWVGLYRRAIFDNVKFPAGKLHEDTGTSHRLIHEAETICFLKKCLYNYRVDRSGSIMNDPNTREHPDLREMLVRKALDLYGWGYQDFAEYYSLRVLIRYETKKSDAKKLGNIIMTGKVPDFYNWQYKGMFYLYRLSPLIFDFVCKLMGRRKDV